MTDNDHIEQQTEHSEQKELILSVSDLTRGIQRTLEQGFERVTIQGEISNFVQHSSGHRYFSLKDSGAQIKAVMWRSSTLRFTPTNGMNVIARGKITMYPPQGTVQIECRSLEPLGVGDLQMAFEALKRKLYELGWFDVERKRPLRRFPRTIGVVTSQTGAAIRDILATLARRMPACEVVLRPTLVQGEGAAEDIAQAIYELNQTSCDILIVGRGGGSIEDLWAFNTEIVAEAIVQSRIPIISAVGHEIDFTIADFVADVRAATPTAAAELAVRDANELLATLRGTQDLLGRLAFTQLSELQQRVERARTHTGFRSVMEQIRLHTQRTDDFKSRMDTALQRLLIAKAEKVRGLEQHLSSLHPLAPLKRGFALLQRNGKPLHADDVLQAGETIDIVREHEQASALILSSESR